MAGKATTIKEAIKRYEDKTGNQATTAKDVALEFQYPPIEKMDATLASLTACEKLSLSTNMIEKITGIATLRNLKILSLGRNYIKTFTGLEALSDTLEELWISYNLIEKIKGLNTMKCLRVLHMSNNLVKEWAEFNKLQEMPSLEDLLFVGNPLYDNCELEIWRMEAAKRLPNLKKLDGETVIRDDGQVQMGQAPNQMYPINMCQTFQMLNSSNPQLILPFIGLIVLFKGDQEFGDSVQTLVGAEDGE